MTSWFTSVLTWNAFNNAYVQGIGTIIGENFTSAISSPCTVGGGIALTVSFRGVVGPVVVSVTLLEREEEGAWGPGCCGTVSNKRRNAQSELLKRHMYCRWGHGPYCIAKGCSWPRGRVRHAV